MRRQRDGRQGGRARARACEREIRASPALLGATDGPYFGASINKIITKEFDVILNMEIVEHVEDVDFFLKSCSNLLKKNGLMLVATINKTLKSYIFAIVGAEYVLRWLPIGTHEWEKFVKPEELKNILIKNNLNLKKIDGMNFNILKDEWNVSKDLSVNYIAEFKKN